MPYPDPSLAPDFDGPTPDEGVTDEILTCADCNQPIVDGEVWDQENDGTAFHPSCRERQEAS